MTRDYVRGGKVSCDHCGPDFMRARSDGYSQCSRCHDDSDLLRGARRVIPGLPATLKEFREQFGAQGVEGLRKSMAHKQRGAGKVATVRLLPSSRKRSTGITPIPPSALNEWLVEERAV